MKAILSTVLSAVVLTASVVTAPFSWSNRQWCPTYNSSSCDRIQTAVESGNNYTVAFDPSMVSVNSHDQLVFSMKYDPYFVNGHEFPYRTGAANTGQQELYGLGWFSARIHLPCQNGAVDNFPAFWLYGNWTNNMNYEVDVMEGLFGKVRGGVWLYKRSSTGVISRAHYPASATLPGYCGWHRFSIYKGLYHITFKYDGVKVGQVTAKQTTAFTGLSTFPQIPQYLRLDWDASVEPYGACCGGPFVPTARMVTSRVKYRKPEA